MGELKLSDVPDVIDVKIGTKHEAKWTEIANKSEEALIANDINREIDQIQRKANQEVLDLANKRIAIEKETYK